MEAEHNRARTSVMMTNVSALRAFVPDAVTSRVELYLSLHRQSVVRKIPQEERLSQARAGEFLLRSAVERSLARPSVHAALLLALRKGDVDAAVVLADLVVPLDAAAMPEVDECSGEIVV